MMVVTVFIRVTVAPAVLTVFVIVFGKLEW